MATRTVKRAGSANTRKKKATPKFLLVKGDGAKATKSKAAAAPAPVDAGAAEASVEEWPQREDIRDGLVDHVSTRFGISHDVAIRAVNDMLRLN